jgi:acyl-coenzyme A thioesterase PaaI-like protein
MTEPAFQDYYPDDLAHCYGCGRLNEHGLQIKSYWDGDDSICHFQPSRYHTSMPGYAYGGLIASLIDCHATGTASAAQYRRAQRPMDSKPPIRFVTASLKVDFMHPTPIDKTLVLRGRVKEIKDKKVIVTVSLSAGDLECARGEVVTVRIPEGWPHTR